MGFETMKEKCLKRLFYSLISQSWRCGFGFLSLGFLLMGRLSSNASQNVNANVCVYGGTDGGVMAAVQAARMGKTVALIVVGSHLGGVTSSGLGETDIGHFGDGYIQGEAREFYTRVGQKYGITGAKFTFEPHVAEAVFDEMAQQAGVNIYTNQHLTSVAMKGQQIVALTMNNGNIIHAKMFIDASNEGDLMAKAGVSYTIGREAISQYGESYNGIRKPNTGGHQFGIYKINPYLNPTDSTNGLLPFIQTNATGTIGARDKRIQAYTYRMCLTQTATNKLPITARTNYDPSQYELLARYIHAMVTHGVSPSLKNFMTISSMPNGKTDINNNGPVSTDFIGQNCNYSEANYTTRMQICQAHRNYIQGLFYFLATDPRVPSNVRSQMQSYGLCKDEFVDNGGWPYQLYVREARRMISDYVMTQSNCLGQVTITDSVGLAAYTMDSHNCQRVVSNGYVQNEGDVERKIPRPYPISYRSIVPKTGQCANLIVPWCLSASHIAFGSIRMEPVFMILGQSAGTAACLAIDEGVAVQNVSVPKLHAQLTSDKQLLYWRGSVARGLISNDVNATEKQ
ncbi:MAG: FAD-dependent oxidoreductase [Limisphaerales bacterium]